jgi:hypothetical protein
MKRLFHSIALLLVSNLAQAQEQILVEAESFINTGGWVVDPQFIQQMGSPYLMAHGMGNAVANATTQINFNEKGEYHIWVRTKNWAPGNWEAPGRFNIAINGKKLKNPFGASPVWNWEYAGTVGIKSKKVEIELIDLTGFNGRCDAIYFSQTKEAPPNSGNELGEWRKDKLGEPTEPEKTQNFDLVITGGGIAGCAAAIAASQCGSYS